MMILHGALPIFRLDTSRFLSTYYLLKILQVQIPPAILDANSVLSVSFRRDLTTTASVHMYHLCKIRILLCLLLCLLHALTHPNIAYYLHIRIPNLTTASCLNNFRILQSCYFLHFNINSII